MKKQTTGECALPRGLLILGTESKQASLNVAGIIRNEKLITKPLIVDYAFTYKDVVDVFKIKSKCPKCNGNLGVLSVVEGKVFFLCWGISCLISK